MSVLHPFDVLVAFTLLVGALPLGGVANAVLWFAIIVAVTIGARHGSIPIRLSPIRREKRDRSR